MAADLISDIILFTAGENEGNDLFNVALAWLKDRKVNVVLLLLLKFQCCLRKFCFPKKNHHQRVTGF